MQLRLRRISIPFGAIKSGGGGDAAPIETYFNSFWCD